VFQVGYEERRIVTTTSTSVGDFDVRDQLGVRSHAVDNSSSPSTAGQGSASRRGLSLDIGLGSGPSRADEPTASRHHEDFNNNDDEARSDEFQTHSVGLRWNEELNRPTVLVVEGQHDVKFIDDDDDSDGVDQKELDRRTTSSTSDEDVGSSDLGRRWGTVDLIPKPSAVSPVLLSNVTPLKSIMKSPLPSSEKTLSKTKKGISFSQDTVFK